MHETQTIAGESRARDQESFEYRYPKNLRVTPVGGERLLADGAFVFVHRQRSRFLESAYGDPRFDEKIESLDLPVVYAAGDVSLFRLDTGKRGS